MVAQCAKGNYSAHTRALDPRFLTPLGMPEGKDHEFLARHTEVDVIAHPIQLDTTRAGEACVLHRPADSRLDGSSSSALARSSRIASGAAFRFSRHHTSARSTSAAARFVKRTLRVTARLRG